MQSQSFTGIVNRFRGFFSSIRLAFFLILVLAGLSLVGALLVQAPAEVAADPESFAAWLEEVARPRFGTWTDVIAFLQLFDIFHSIWFLGAGILLIINIFVCSLNRFRAFRWNLARVQIRVPDDVYRKADKKAELNYRNMSRQDSANRLAATLSRLSYRVGLENYQNNTYVKAEKNRYSGLGTYINHLSLILLIIGFLIGSFFGFRDTSFIVSEGDAKEVGYGTSLKLQLDSFSSEYWPDGTPKDYRSEIVLYDGSAEVKRGTIRVNYPLGYKGVRFFQSFFGPTVSVRVEKDGAEIFSGSVQLSAVLDDSVYRRPSGHFILSEENLTIYLIGSASDAADPMVPAGQVAVQLFETDTEKQIALARLEKGVTRDVSGLSFTYLSDGEFSGFQVSYDPGTWLIWLASGLFLFGIGLVFYLPHVEVRGLLEITRNQETRLTLYIRPLRYTESEMRKIKKQLQNEIPSSKVSRG